MSIVLLLKYIQNLQNHRHSTQYYQVNVGESEKYTAREGVAPWAGRGQRDPNIFRKLHICFQILPFGTFLLSFSLRKNAIAMKKREFCDGCMRANYGCVH